jgi:hypothetical protein
MKEIIIFATVCAVGILTFAAIYHKMINDDEAPRND